MTDFKYFNPDNKTDKPDKVIAIADGALQFTIDKVSSGHQGLWSRQKACMLFEVSLFSSAWLMAGEKVGDAQCSA